MNEDDIFREWLMREGFPDDIEKYADLKNTTSFALYRLVVARDEFARTLNISLEKLVIELEKSISAATNSLATLFDKANKTLHRPPVEIKKDIKHEKNPMRLKQLNQELNDAYKSRIGRKR